MIDELDVAEAEPFGLLSRTGLLDADGQFAVGHVYEHAVGIASGGKGDAAAGESSYDVSLDIARLVLYLEVGHITREMTVIAVHGFVLGYHILDECLEVVVDAVGVEHAGIVGVLEVFGAWIGTEGSVHL